MLRYALLAAVLMAGADAKKAHPKTAHHALSQLRHKMDASAKVAKLKPTIIDPEDSQFGEIAIPTAGATYKHKPVIVDPSEIAQNMNQHRDEEGLVGDESDEEVVDLNGDKVVHAIHDPMSDMYDPNAPEDAYDLPEGEENEVSSEDFADVMDTYTDDDNLDDAAYEEAPAGEDVGMDQAEVMTEDEPEEKNLDDMAYDEEAPEVDETGEDYEEPTSGEDYDDTAAEDYDDTAAEDYEGEGDSAVVDDSEAAEGSSAPTWDEIKAYLKQRIDEEAEKTKQAVVDVVHQHLEDLKKHVLEASGGNSDLAGDIDDEEESLDDSIEDSSYGDEDEASTYDDQEEESDSYGDADEESDDSYGDADEETATESYETDVEADPDSDYDSSNNDDNAASDDMYSETKDDAAAADHDDMYSEPSETNDDDSMYGDDM